MPSISDKKSGWWLQFLEKHHLWLPKEWPKAPRQVISTLLPDHLWPPKEWPKAPWFMKRYFDMLFIILVILGVAFFLFMFGVEDGANNDTDMEVTIGITVGMFGILATFAVVFFAFRAEQTAVNVTSEVAKLFVEKAFFEEEQEVIEMLGVAETNTNSNERQKEKPIFFLVFGAVLERIKKLIGIAGNSDPNTNSNEKRKKMSIYDDVDTPWWQFFAWGAIFFLAFGSFFWLTGFLDLKILTNGENSNDGLKLQILTLFIGMLAVLIAFTVILFAARVAQLSEVAGRIESQSIIRKLAASNEELYHKLFETHNKIRAHKIRAHKKSERLPSTTVLRFKLLNTPHEDFDRKEKDNFETLSDNQPSDEFSRGIAFLALGTICFIGLDMLRGEERSIDGIISSSAVLFTLLIFSTSVFFLGRVLKSALASSREEAAKASYSAFEQRRIELNNRIEALREIEKNETSLDEFLDLLYSNSAEENIIWKDMPIEQMVSTLMHLRHLKGVWEEQDTKAKKNSYFLAVYEIIESRFEYTRDSFKNYLKFGSWGKEWETLGYKISPITTLMKERACEFEKEYNDNEARYDSQPLFNFVKGMEKEKFKKYLEARTIVKDILPKLACMTKLSVMIKLLEIGLFVLKENMMPVELKEPKSENNCHPHPADTDLIEEVIEDAKDINSIFEDYVLFTPSLLDADESKLIFMFEGFDNIEQWEKYYGEKGEDRNAFLALRSIELLKDLEKVFPNAFR